MVSCRFTPVSVSPPPVRHRVRATFMYKQREYYLGLSSARSPVLRPHLARRPVFPPRAQRVVRERHARRCRCYIACSSWWSRSSRPRRRRRTRAWVRTTPRRTVRGHQPAPHGPWLPPDVHFALAQMESAALRATTRRRVTGAQLPFCPRIIRLAQIYSVRALAGTSARLLARRSRPTGSCEELMVHR